MSDYDHLIQEQKDHLIKIAENIGGLMTDPRFILFLELWRNEAKLYQESVFMDEFKEKEKLFERIGGAKALLNLEKELLQNIEVGRDLIKEREMGEVEQNNGTAEPIMDYFRDQPVEHEVE
jgi:hypothetical protein